MSLLAATATDGLEFTLVVAILIIGGLIGIASIVALILRIKIFFVYWITNRQRASGGYTGETAAKTLLKNLGYDEIEVEQCGFSAIIFGNHYNPNKKTVYLRRSAFAANNMTAVGLALQKVGIAVLDKKDGSVKRRWRLEKLGIFGPILFIPIVLVGVILDFVTLLATDGQFSGMFTIICAILALAFFIASFVLSILNIKVEKRANRETLELIKGQDFLNAHEIEYVSKVFKTYLLAYITDFLIGLLELIRLILKIILLAVRLKKD